MIGKFFLEAIGRNIARLFNVFVSLLLLQAGDSTFGFLHQTKNMVCSDELVR